MDTLPRLTPGPLAVADRCDRCGARAYVRAILPSGHELLFCGHHGGELRPSLILQGAAMHDETGVLTAARREPGAAA